MEQRAEETTLEARFRAQEARRAMVAAEQLASIATRAAEGATGRICDPAADRLPAAFSPEILMGSGFNGPSGFSAPPSPPPSPPPTPVSTSIALTHNLPDEDKIGFVVVKGRRPGIYRCL